MADPSRDHETSALERVDELERENEELEEELAIEREKITETEERDPEARRLEEEMNALKKQVETLKAAPQTVDDNSDPMTNLTATICFVVLVLFVVGVLFFLK
jgi:hypothetical protein